MVKTLKLANDFDSTLGAWTQKVGPQATGSFSQFAVMGAYAEHFGKDVINTVVCPLASDSTHNGSHCAHWLPVGVHYGWRYCYYLHSCEPGDAAPAKFHSANHGDLLVSAKFGNKSVELIQDIMHHGLCFEKALFGNQSRTSHVECGSQNPYDYIHKELRPYPRTQIGQDQRLLEPFNDTSDATCQAASKHAQGIRYV